MINFLLSLTYDIQSNFYWYQHYSCLSFTEVLFTFCMVLLSLGAEDGDSLMGKMKKWWKNRQAL